ncbi:MAG TPA: V-type ATP synthase subunit E family protein [Nitrososphaerales archaeon]
MVNERKSFENVIGKVVKDAELEIISSLNESYKEALDIIDTAEKNSSKSSAEIPRLKERQADLLKKRILGGAELKARNKTLNVVDEYVNKVFEESLKKMTNLSSDKKYGLHMKKLLEEGIDEIEGQNFIAYSNSSDKELIKKIIKDIENSKSVKIKLHSETLGCRGGVKLMNKEGSIIYDNTIESRLERLKSLLRKEVADVFTK